MKNSLLVFLICLYNFISAETKPKSAISFTENKGQVSDQNNNPRTDVLFSGSNNGMVFHLKKNSISYQLSQVDSWKENDLPLKGRSKRNKMPDKYTIYRIDLNWLNTNKDVVIEKQNKLQGCDNYYLETCPNGVTNVESYKDLTYKNIYNGIDLHYYGQDGNLKYDYLVQAYTDYRQIQMQIEGASDLKINSKGELEIVTPLGKIVEKAPVVIQNKKLLKSKWVVKENVVRFDISGIDPSQAFIIDPIIAVRAWGTYYGDVNTDRANSCTTDIFDSVYMCGMTDLSTGTTIATIGAYQTVISGNDDSYVVKFNSNGVRKWGTYYGSLVQDGANCCVTDLNANIYVAGQTNSTSTVLATPGAFQTIPGGGPVDAFLVKFDSSGIRQWGTYYGGANNETGWSCATDRSGNIYMAGQTASNGGTIIATPGSHQPSFGFGLEDAFLVKFNSAGTRLWATFYGGSSQDDGYSCATDSLRNVYLTGTTNSNTGTVIATSGSHQPTLGSFGNDDAFLAKFDSSGTRIWATYYGGTTSDIGQCCTIDKAGMVYLGGWTTSANAIATPGAHQTTISSVFPGDDGFLVKFNASTGVRQWGTYYGGTNADMVEMVAIGDSGKVYIAGITNSNTGTVIATSGSYQSFCDGSDDAFLVRFDSAGVRQWGTYYGGGSSDQAYSCCTDKKGGIYIAGVTTTGTGTIIATAGSQQPVFGGAPYSDGMLVKFFECSSPLPPANNTNSLNLTICSGATAALSVSGTGTVSWYSSLTSYTPVGSGTLFTTPVLTTGINPGTYTFYAASTNTCYESSRLPITVTVVPNPTVNITGNTSICGIGSSSLSVTGSTSYTWSTGSNNTSIVVSPSITSSYSVAGTYTNGCQSSAVTTVTVFSNPLITINTSNTLICTGQTATLTSNGANTYTWSTSSSGSVIAVSPSVTITYSVTGTDANGCTNSSTITQSVSACTGINEYLNAESLNIYPNPNQGEFLVSLANVTEKTTIEIYYPLGKMIFTKELKETGNKINITEFPEGIYVLKIISDKQLIKAGKLIKIR